MRLPADTHEKMMSAYHLFGDETLSISAFEHIRILLKGIHPKVDEKLEICSRALDVVQKVQNGDIITLSVEGLPEDTEEKKKRKKALLFFISSLKDLESEVKRIDAEFIRAQKSENPTQNQLTAWGRIIAFAKGPFGIATLIGLIIVGVVLLYRNKATPSPITVSSNQAKIQIILYQGKQIPLNQLSIGHGSDCDSPHYHAVTGKVTTLDGMVIPDPENCGYGKVKDVEVSEVTFAK